MNEDASIKLHPFLGRSKNLIEFFFIIGYDEKILLENYHEIQKKEENLKLSVISSVSSDSSFNNIDFNDIIKKIYPDKPSIIKVIKPELKQKTTSIIFSSCFNSNKGDHKKIFYSCYAFTFYEILKEYYIPKAFLILSEYPYFTTFHNICLNLYENLIEKKEKTNNIIKNIQYIQDNIPIEILIYCLVNYTPSPINSNIEFNLLADDKPIIIPKLTAYPYIDFDLFKIINEISINELIKIYILVLLELPLVFFSKNIEKLNLFMFALYILNYPLTNSFYFYHIFSISEKEIKNVLEHPLDMLRGVNKDYDKNINYSGFGDLKFVVDMNNKKLVFKDKNANDIKILLDYIDNILNDNKVKSFFLSYFLSFLKNKLNKIKKKVKDVSNSYFYIDDNVSQINKEIQEAFYDFIINILVVLYKDYEVNDTFSSIIKKKNNINNEYSEEEKIFIKYMKYSDKYGRYFDDFILNNDTFDEFKVSLFFCDEFIHMKRVFFINKKSNNINYFNIIKKIYCSELTVEKINYENVIKNELSDLKKILVDNKKNVKKRELFYLDKNVINTFIFYKKNKQKFKSFKEREKIQINIKTIDKTTIQLNFMRNFSENQYINISLIYIFSVVFPLLSFNTAQSFLSNILNSLKINTFQRNYIYIILKAINQYYLLNQKNKYFSELNLNNVNNYCLLIKNCIIKNSIIPNKEILLLLNKFLLAKNNNINPNEENNNHINENGENNFVFQYNKEENLENNINYNITIKNEILILFNYLGKNEEYQLIRCDSNLCLNSYSLYDGYFSNNNLNINNLNIKNILELIINNIYYLKQNKEMILVLIKVVNALKKFEFDLNEFNKKNNNLNNDDLNK